MPDVHIVPAHLSRERCPLEESRKILIDVWNKALNLLPPDLEQTGDNGSTNGGSDSIPVYPSRMIASALASVTRLNNVQSWTGTSMKGYKVCSLS